MSLVDDLIKLLPKSEQQKATMIASYLWDMINDLDRRQYLRSELTVEKKEKDRLKIMRILEHSRKIVHAFNVFFDMYVDRIKKNSRRRLNKFLELNRDFGFTEEDVGYLLFSEMIFIFMSSVELFRIALLFTMKMNIDKTIHHSTTLGALLRRLEKIGIKRVDLIKEEIDVELRNSLSHGMYCIDGKTNVHYFTDIAFEKEKVITGSELYFKMRNQTMMTELILRVIGDWFI